MHRVDVGRDPLSWAMQHRQFLIPKLIDLGLDLNQEDHLGETPLEIALQRADIEIARLLDVRPRCACDRTRQRFATADRGQDRA